MITIYDSRETDFSTLGLCVLQPTECTIEGEENGMMELSMTHPMDRDGRWLNLAEYNIIRAPAPVRETPLIRVLDNPGASGKTATRTICKVKTYTGKRLRLRAKPSTSAKVLGYYAPGTEVMRLSVSGDWAQVVIVKGGASGWMSNERLQVVRTEAENVSGSGTENVSKCIEPRQTREQLFRICEVETDDEAGLVYVTAKHIFYDLAYNIVKGDYSPDGAAVGEVCAQLLARALDPHDFTVYCTAEGTVTGDYGRKGIANCLLESEIGVADQTGAKIVLDNYDVFVLKDETRDNGVEIRHAKNMTGATLKKNVESTITRIVPVGKDKNGDPLPLPNGEYVETPRAASIPVIHSKEIEYDVSVGKNEGEYKDNAAAYAKLRELATADFADNALDAVTVGLDVDFVILENRHSESYAAYAALQTIHMGDTVRVVSSRSGIDAKLRMTGFTYDAMYPNGGRYKKVRLGQLTDLKTQVYGFDIARGTTPGNKILPNSLDGQAALKNATIGYAKIAQAAIEQLAADSIVAIRADIHEIVAGSVTTDQLYADLARLAVAQITTANIKEANIDWAQIAELTAQIANISKAQITTANINAANINWAQITSLSAAIADIATAKIGEAEIKSAQITDLEAEVARIAAAKIAVADIDWAHIKDLVAGTAIFTAGVGDKLHIARLAVTEANMVSLSVGELLVKGQDGSFYSVSVDADGNIVTEKKQVVNSDVKDLSINAGEKIIEGTVTAACLNANDIFANNATIKQLIAANIDVDTLFAREATINSLNAMDIRGNKYLQLYVTDKVDNISVGGRNLLRGTNQGAANWNWSMQTGGKTVEEYLDGGVRAVKMTRDAVEQAGWSVITYAISEDTYAHLEPNTEYTLSFDYKPSVATANGIMFAIKKFSGADAASGDGGYWKEIPANEWTHVSGQFTTAEEIPAYELNSYCVYITRVLSAVNSVHIFKNLKLEKGNKSTDWSPAPEDIEARVTTAESKIDQKADSITLSVLETKVDGISVGGRNMYTGTRNFDGDTWWMNASHWTADGSYNGCLVYKYTGQWNGLGQMITLEANTQYTLSAWMKQTDGGTVKYYDSKANGATSSDKGSGSVVEVGTDWSRCHVTFTVSTAETYFPRFEQDGEGQSLWVAGLKLEKGNKATDWSPAPEDPAGSLSVSSDYSKVDINKDRVRIVSKRMEVAVPSDDGEDDVLRVDADGVHAEVVEADRIVSDSVVHTQAAESYTPANAGELAAYLEGLSGKCLTGDVDVNCINVSSGSFEVQGLCGAAGKLTLRNGALNALTVRGCGRNVIVYVESMVFSTSGVAVTVDDGAVMLLECSLNAGTGLRLGANWPSEAWLSDCEGDCTTLAALSSFSRLWASGIKPTGTLSLGEGSEVYNATPDPTFETASAPSIPTTQTVTVSLSPTSTSTSGYGSKLYQGRYSSSQSLRKGVMLFSLPSDLTSADKIDSATLTIKRIGGVGQGGGVNVHVRCYDVPGTLYASKTAYENQTVSIDVTSAVKAMKTSGYTGLMLYNPETTTVGGKSYTASYSRFAGKGESGAPVLKVSYRK